MKYKCIIFDCDGVLVDSEEISNRVLFEMINEIGFHIDQESAIEKFSGRSLKSLFEYIEQENNKKLPASFQDDYRRKTFESFKTDLQPINGIHDLLDKISIPICVASSGPMEKIKLNLTTTKLISRFNNKLFSAYDIGSWKPNPEIFLYAAKEMGYMPKDCIVIEDSIAGIRAAKSGGFDVCGYTSYQNREKYEDEGAIVIHEMKEIIDIIK